jgi:UDP-N-acetylglucosamine--N-acetylmuramyl-(pentapeptide) pyrophosphoryl-undecaprenol N-acetylglucosamine transferase
VTGESENGRGLCVVFAGGGTGGHLFPALAIHEQLATMGDVRALYLCSRRPLDAEILKNEGVAYEPIPAEPFGVHPKRLLKFMWTWGDAVRAARTTIRRLKKESARVEVVAMGGFAAAPVAHAARLERCRVTLVNLDAVPGRANRLMSKRAATILTATAAQGFDWTVVPPIVRKAALAPGDAAHCRRELGLDAGKHTLLVTGASQGAGSINKLMLAMAKQNAAALAGWQVIHQTGKSDTEELRAAYASAGVHALVEPFFRVMGELWGAADCAVSRCGAGSVAEAWANKVPAIFLPYPYHKDEHQRRNAEPLERAGGCEIVTDQISPEANLPEAGARTLALMADGGRRDAMRAGLASLGPADGAARVARAIVSREAH